MSVPLPSPATSWTRPATLRGVTPSFGASVVSTAVTVLVANSKEMIRLGLRAMLAKSVRIVGEASSGDSLLSLIKKHRPQVLLMDTAMTGENDCFALLKKFAKSFPEMKAILVSAVDNPTYMARAKRPASATSCSKA